MIDALSERILNLEAPGGPLTRLSVVAPSIVAPGEPFALRLAALDANGYPSIECDAAARADVGVLAFTTGRPAVGSLDGSALTDEGLYRIPVSLDGKAFLSNPIRCRANPTHRIFWGDPHVHTVLSDCHPGRCRSLDFCFVCARHVTGLDWVCAADHVSNGRTSPGKWRAQCEAAKLFDDPPRFATILGFEASLKGGCGGDNNIYFAGEAETYADAYDDGDVRTLAQKLAGQDSLIVPHHTTRAGKHGELADQQYLGRDLMPAIEIHSKWGTSEYRDNPNALHDIHPGPSYAQDFLARGMAFGFIAGTDTHATMPSGYGEDSPHIDRLPGITAVLAPNNRRGDLHQGLRARSCYGTSAERILIECDLPMGAEVAWPDPNRPRAISASIAAESDVLRVDVVRNGRDVYSLSGTDWQATVDWTDEEPLSDVALEPAGAFSRPFAYYYLRVTCASGAQGWTRPTWLTI